jgi:transposase
MRTERYLSAAFNRSAFGTDRRFRVRDSEERAVQTVTTIGFDIAKSVFQVHGVDATGQVVIRRQLKRRHVLAFFEKLPPCLIGIEACASSTVRLLPPSLRETLRQTAEKRHG